MSKDKDKNKNKNELIIVKNGEVFTTSLIISNGANINHRQIKETIQKHSNKIKSFGLLVAYHAESTGGRPSEYYILNEPQATFLITLLKNTDAVVNFKLELVQQFYNMKQVLMHKSTIEWKEARAIGKEARRELTDTIRDYLIPLAIEQGSQNCDKYYKHYSVLASAIVSVPDREYTNSESLHNLRIVENIIINVIMQGVTQKKYYKDIYRDCKKRLQQFKEIAFLE